MSVKILDVEYGSLAEKNGILAQDDLISINGNEIFDILDYRFYEVNKRLKLEILRREKKLTFNISKDEYTSLGLVFDSYLMDKEKSCKNKCIFCFIDQLPKGLRDTLYFKDDDSRLSFLLGNYITLTNLSQRDVDRIIKMHISPMNVSVHATNPELRCKMMNNRFAGESLDILNKFHEANIKMNCQIVLCPDINDGTELERTLNDLKALFPSVESIAVVPVGLTKYREGLYPLRAFSQVEANNIIDTITSFGNKCKEEFGTRLVFPADEFYLKAKREMPNASFFEEFSQLENGIGMSALFKDEFDLAFDENKQNKCNNKISVATSVAAFPLIASLVDRARKKYKIEVNVYEIQNNFFGKDITVSGLITATDLVNSLKNKELGDKLLIPSNMLRSEKDMFLDSITVEEVEKELATDIHICDIDGYEFLLAMIEK